MEENCHRWLDWPGQTQLVLVFHASQRLNFKNFQDIAVPETESWHPNVSPSIATCSHSLTIRSAHHAGAFLLTWLNHDVGRRKCFRLVLEEMW